MLLSFDARAALAYKSPSQKIRVMTERWVNEQVYCHACGNSLSTKFEAGRPVADFFCGKCAEQFELKSKKGGIASSVVDGAYRKMIERISAADNPNFFFLGYEGLNLQVQSLFE